MKKTTLIILAVLGIGLVAAPAVAANHNDFKIIQKAVKQNPAYEEGKEVKWFKVLITDGKTNDAKVKVTLPIALVEVLINCTDSRHFKIDDGDCDIDLKAVWAALKQAGPMALVEIEDDGAIIKVWLE
jgi:sugar phosphate isomerase/epimerase